MMSRMTRSGGTDMRRGWELPQPRTTAEIQTSDGTRIILRRHGNPDGPRLVLSHGNGLAADLYYPFWSLLADRFDLVVYDLRNHGWNPPSDIRSHNVATFVSDNECVAHGIDRHFGKKPRIGLFHSLSAVLALRHEPPGEGFEALVLFDPPIYPPGGNPLDIDALWKKFAIGSRLRQDRFATRDEFARSIRRSPYFKGLAPGVADLFAETTLRPLSDGSGYGLRCARECEARVFEYIFAYHCEPAPESFACPVKVIGGDPTASFSFLPSMDLSAIVGLDYDFVPETTHFLQIEKPAACVSRMLEFLGRKGLV
ncbi:MAG: alpha/beta hydrolase [Acidobacteria bacterium]|nr:alpha/beta hydrolase [Acidobacteriota bacterium]MYE45116.1 alpha/beta hydrolase [Acidobacteriota bacterium]